MHSVGRSNITIRPTSEGYTLPCGFLFSVATQTQLETMYPWHKCTWLPCVHTTKTSGLGLFNYGVVILVADKLVGINTLGRHLGSSEKHAAAFIFDMPIDVDISTVCD